MTKYRILLTFDMAFTATTYIETKVLPINGILYFPFKPVWPSVAGTYTYSVSPGLPAGLYLTTSTGYIGGASATGFEPIAVSSATDYTITITQAAPFETDSSTFNLSVVQTPLRYRIHTDKITGVVDYPIFGFVTGIPSGGTRPFSYEITPALPPGIEYASTSGVISGIPSVAVSAQNYSITLTDAVSTVTTQTFTLGVIEALNTVSTVDTIKTSHYNTLTVVSNDILGPGINGYGSLSANKWLVTNKNLVTLYGWERLLNDLYIISKHITNYGQFLPLIPQTLTNTTLITSTITNSIIRYETYLEANRYNCHPLQYQASLVTGSTIYRGSNEERYGPLLELPGISSRTSTWGIYPEPSIRHIIEYTFLTGDAARYFFNAGGEIVWEPNYQATSINPSELDVEWAEVINKIIDIGGYVYSRDQFNSGDVTFTYDTISLQIPTTLAIDIIVTKNLSQDERGQIENVITLTIEFRNENSPDFVVTPSVGLWQINVP